MTSNYISIKSILYDLSLVIDDRYWNETKMSEWAHKALRMIHTDQTLETKVTYVEVCNHKAVLPSDLKYLTQIAYMDKQTEISTHGLFLPETSDLGSLFITASKLGWKAMRLTSNPYHSSICLDKKLGFCTDCTHEFSVSPDLILTTTLKDGVILISYLAWMTDEDGYSMIPDNEFLKESILHFILYRYWMSKMIMKEEGAAQQMQFHLQMWNTLSKKAAGELNLPDVNELENLKNQMNRVLPRTNRFQQLFLTLGNRENVNF